MGVIPPCGRWVTAGCWERTALSRRLHVLAWTPAAGTHGRGAGSGTARRVAVLSNMSRNHQIAVAAPLRILATNVTCIHFSTKQPTASVAVETAPDLLSGFGSRSRPPPLFKEQGAQVTKPLCVPPSPLRHSGVSGLLLTLSVALATGLADGAPGSPSAQPPGHLSHRTGSRRKQAAGAQVGGGAGRCWGREESTAFLESEPTYLSAGRR